MFSKKVLKKFCWLYLGPCALTKRASKKAPLETYTKLILDGNYRLGGKDVWCKFNPSDIGLIADAAGCRAACDDEVSCIAYSHLAAKFKQKTCWLKTKECKIVKSKAKFRPSEIWFKHNVQSVYAASMDGSLHGAAVGSGQREHDPEHAQNRSEPTDVPVEAPEPKPAAAATLALVMLAFVWG